MAISKSNSSAPIRLLPGKVREPDMTRDFSTLWGDWPGGFLPRVLSIRGYPI
jgi:hypothetical protein